MTRPLLFLAVLSCAALPLVTTGCDDCDPLGQTAENTLGTIVADETVDVELDQCSTCAHTTAEFTWKNTGFPQEAIGTVQVSLSPGCFVRGQEIDVPINIGKWSFDTNVRNCGDVVSYYASMKNRTTFNLEDFKVVLTCPSVKK